MIVSILYPKKSGLHFTLKNKEMVLVFRQELDG